MIPYGRQTINEDDITSVVEVLRSEWLTQGPVVPLYERAVLDYVGADFAIAVNSATSALHIACLALELGPGDWLWTSPNTFVASANCALYCGANVDFVDIDPATYNMSVDALSQKLQWAESLGRLPKIVVPVHFSGQSCDMAKIYALSQRYGFKIIEDASHAIGAKYKDKPVGSCAYSDMVVFSFHPVKIITTGEGGMVVTNNAVFADRMQELRSHGITRDPDKMRYPQNNAWYYEQSSLGYNYRMTDIQAALGLSQLKRLDEFIIKRHELAAYYNKKLVDLPLILPFQDQNTYSSFHLYVIQIDNTRSSIERDMVFEQLRASKIGVNVHYIPVHLQPYYRAMNFHLGQFPVSEQYYAHTMTLPLFFDLDHVQQDKIIATIQEMVVV